MGRRPKGPRANGPYRRPGRGDDDSPWVLVVFRPDGQRRDLRFATEEEANAWARDYTLKVVAEKVTVRKALDDYRDYLLNAKGNKPGSVSTTITRLEAFLPGDATPLASLTPRWGRKAYATYATSGVSVDTHRNVLAEARTFFRWAIKRQAWLRIHPLDDVVGEGKRTHGKEQLRADEWRTLVGHAAFKARRGDLGAVAVLCAAWMGLRSGEIVRLQVRDVDDGGRVLWIAEAKTRAGRRRVAIPTPIQSIFATLTKGRAAAEPLFGEEHWRDWPRKNLQRMLRVLKLPVITAHGLRGTLATLGYEAGMVGQGVADHFGHESERTTQRSYARSGARAEAELARG
ncbi:MAG: tyrosine-type recombinase/integrase, partial [Baekduiaceae bacterium]